MIETIMDDGNKPLVLLSTAVLLPIVYCLYVAIHGLFIHPLRHIPGPKINALSRFPYAYHMKMGTTVPFVQALHEKYGEIVRVSPNELSFSAGESAWPDIYGFRTGKLKGHSNMMKDPVWYPSPVNGSRSIFTADDEKHSQTRKVLSHAFSDRALMEQEDLIQQYVDLLISRLKETTANTNKPTDLVEWYNWTTFDVIADLMFGEPFGCLKDLSTHKHIETLFSAVMGGRNQYYSYYFPLISKFFVNKEGGAARVEFFGWVREQCQKRLDREIERPDFMEKIVEHNGKNGKEVLTFKEIVSNGGFFLTAGSETTATLLSGVTYYLLKNPAVMSKLKEEIRGNFPAYDDITIDAVNKSPYLIAVLQEALRLYPPVPTGFPRVTPPGGEVISDTYIPEKTSVYVSQYAVSHSSRNFKDADSFVPERWMGDEKYADDRRNAVQPFSFGPRNCLGKNLAYAEMRLILAKMVWSFDMEMDPTAQNWLQDNRVFTLWKKPNLATKLTDVVRS